MAYIDRGESNASIPFFGGWIHLSGRAASIFATILAVSCALLLCVLLALYAQKVEAAMGYLFESPITRRTCPPLTLNGVYDIRNDGNSERVRVACEAAAHQN